MPRISAPTVAEHRARQEAVLLDAARAVLAEHGPAAVTPGAVGARAGLARTSVYKYFGSTEEILARLVEDGFRHWAALVRAAVDAAGTPTERIEAYARATLDLAASDDDHGLGTVPAGAYLGPAWQARLAELHRELTAPLDEALHASGDPHPDLTAALVQGVIDGAIRLLDGAGRDRSTHVIDAALRFLHAALHSTTGEPPCTSP